MIAFAQPVLGNFLLRRTGQISKLEGHGRNPVTDKVVLITADEGIPLRLRIRLGFDAQALGNLGSLFAQIGFVDPKNR